MSGEPIVCIVDDDDSVRTALARLLRAGGYEVRGYASAGDFLLDDTSQPPACLVLDVRMPGPSGLDLQSALAKRDEPAPIVFLTGHGDIPMSVHAMRAGAVDFLTKPVDKDALLRAVRNAVSQYERDREEHRSLSGLRRLADSLTSQERRVFMGVIAGQLNKQIAADLGISERTVKAHRARVMQKTGAGSLAELVRLGDRLGLTPEIPSSSTEEAPD